jgi:hypothetical protein
MFDQDSNDAIDSRTGALGMGLRLQSTDACEILRHMSDELQVAIMESEVDDYREFEVIGIKLSLVAEFADKSVLAGLPQMDTVCDQAIVAGLDALDAFAPMWTYYGFHKEDASALGVWIDWREIQASDKIVQIEGVWSYVRINYEDKPSVLFDSTGSIVEDPEEILGATEFVYEVAAGDLRHQLVDMDDDRTICVSPLGGILVFAA